MKLEMEERAHEGREPTAVHPMRRRAGRQDLEGWRVELDDFYERMTSFANNEDMIFFDLSAMSSRASQIRSLVVRQENKALQVFRTQEIDPFLRECERQFKIWSRVLTVSQHEWEITTR